MCGIAGVISVDRPGIERALPAMLAAQLHRGPDDVGQQIVPFGNEFLGLGHRRLSILDLSPLGHQPMIHPLSGDQIIFNGEIYNFLSLRRELEGEGSVFRGHSDTEVLLHALTRWGPDCIKRLQGMYAFAFFNARSQEVVLARDPLGIKPLYMTTVPGALMFASEVRPLLASGMISRTFDPQGIAGVLAYGTVQHPFTVFRDVKSFPPGCWQIIKAGAIDSRPPPTRFWDYPQVDARLEEPEAAERLRGTLEEAVRDHLVADVPVGLFLSSGLDSTIIAGLARRHSEHVRSFTVGFADQPDLSEIDLATETARLFGLDHTNIQINARDAEAAAEEWLSALDQPSLDGLNVFVISKAVRARGITVALSGQGGDELFGGYPSFADVPRLRRIMRGLRCVPRALRGPLSRVAALGRSEAVAQKLLDISMTDGGVLDLCLHRRRMMSRHQLAALGLEAPDLALTENFQQSAIEREVILNGDVISAVSRVESAFYQGNVLLRDGDVNGMAHSLEIRVPILDQRVIDFAHSIPGHVRLPSGTADKHLLRVSFASMLRPRLLEQKKRGFSLPIRRWMLGPLRPLCETALGRLKSTGMLRAEGIDAVWQSFLKAPETPIWSRAFTLCVLGTYLDRATRT